MLADHGDLMENVLFILNPNHQLFRSSIHDCKSVLTQEDLKIIQSFNTSTCRQTQGRFFKRSKTQSIEYKKTLSQIKTVNKQNKVKQKKQQLMMLNKQAQELENSQIQENNNYEYDIYYVSLNFQVIFLYIV